MYVFASYSKCLLFLSSFLGFLAWLCFHSLILLQTSEQDWAMAVSRAILLSYATLGWPWRRVLHRLRQTLCNKQSTDSRLFFATQTCTNLVAAYWNIVSDMKTPTSTVTPQWYPIVLIAWLQSYEFCWMDHGCREKQWVAWRKLSGVVLLGWDCVSWARALADFGDRNGVDGSLEASRCGSALCMSTWIHLLQKWRRSCYWWANWGHQVNSFKSQIRGQEPVKSVVPDLGSYSLAQFHGFWWILWINTNELIWLHWLITSSYCMSLYTFGVQDMFNASDNLAEHFEFLDQQPKIFPGETSIWCMLMQQRFTWLHRTPRKSVGILGEDPKKCEKRGFLHWWLNAGTFDGPVQGRVVFEQVSFAYPTRPEQKLCYEHLWTTFCNENGGQRHGDPQKHL